MANTLPADFCPYKGLQPYTQQDRAFFFGRERDQQIIISNLYASQVTVFYGASGVGKSSVLLAGSVPLLQQEKNLAVVVFRNWQVPTFLWDLKTKTLEAVNQAAGREIVADLSLPLDEFLEKMTRALRGPIFFIFDQFEEYFLYNPGSADSDGFEAEFARAVNRKDVNVNFLLSLREDGLSKLDRFQGRIPTLLSNMLRLEHLDIAAARDAITKPLEVYNRQLPDGQPPMTIEPELVEAVLNDLRGVKVASEQAGRGQVGQPSSDRNDTEIETPFLQVVLMRLWNEERAVGSHVLRLQTFEALGRAENIARTHLDNVMSKLTAAEHNDAASILRYLVTPSGTKIAQEAGALASWTELTEQDTQAILTRLSAQDMRILRTIQAPGQPTHYEIFHDVLAQAILNWRRRFVAQQLEEKIRQEEQERVKEAQSEAERRRELEGARRLRKLVTGLSVLTLVMAGVLVFGFYQRHRATKAVEQAIEAAKKEKQQNEKEKLTAAALEVLKDKQGEAEKHILNARAHLKSKGFVEAVREYDEAIKLDPNNPSAYSAKGYALMRDGKYPEAIETLEALKSKYPDYVWAHYNLALTYHLYEKPEKALAEAKAVLAIDPAFCSTYKKDPNFKWFSESTDYAALCKQEAPVPPE